MNKKTHKCEADKWEFYFARMEERLDSIDRTLAAQNVSLEEHIRRTELLENEVKPLSKFYSQWVGVFKFISIAGIIATIIATLMKFKT